MSSDFCTIQVYTVIIVIPEVMFSLNTVLSDGLQALYNCSACRQRECTPADAGGF